MNKPICCTLCILAATATIAWSGTEEGNLLMNASFEYESCTNHADAIYWKQGDPNEHGDAWGSASREFWRAVEGRHLGAIRGQWADAGDYGGFWQEVPVAPGIAYRIGGWFYADTDWSAGVQELKCEYWNETRDQLISTETYPISPGVEEWKNMELLSTAPEEAAWLRLVINVAEAGPSGALQIDKLYIRDSRNKDQETLVDEKQ